MTARFFVTWILFVGALTSINSQALEPGGLLKTIAVQDAGRLKPFDSFSREVLEIVYGKTSLDGRQAYEVVLTWMLSPEAWQNKPLFEVRNSEVLKALEMDPNQRYFKGQDLFSGERFINLRQELQEKRQTKEKLTPYFQALQRLENQFFMFTEMASGRLLRIMPPKTGDSWISVADLQGESREAFQQLAIKFVGHITSIGNNSSQDLIRKAAEELDQSVVKFKSVAKAANPELYPDESKIDTEVHYNSFHPFRWSYIFYLLSACILLFAWITDKSRLMPVVWLIFAVGFIFHIYGFGIRVYLSGRPPVSNMYETVVWVSFGSLLFATVLELIYRFKFILLAGLLVGVFGMVVADSAPVILDPSIQPLEPVLRSNYWLIVHVMTITISYAAFFLALMLGDIALFYYLRDEKKHQAKIKSITLSIYRAKQIGISFLAPGIILGGIWADYSWGRFWGWDPKETWALIVLLGYIAVLHGKMVGWIKDFGMVVSAVLTFTLVIMAWYGVNFVLGAGLHSYGFGAGGIEYVLGFVFLQLLLVVYTVMVRRGRRLASM